MFLDPKYFVGKTFTVRDPAIEYTAVGYDNNGTSIIFGVNYDSVNNRSTLKSFKVTEVTFKGNLTVPTP